MALSRKLLGDDEQVVVATRSHPKALVLPLLWMLLIAIAAGVLASLPSGAAAGPLSAAIWGVALLAIGWLTVRPALRWLTTEYTVTDRRLVTRTGILTRTGHDIPLARISDVSYERDLLDRILGCGTLVVADASERSVRLHDIPHAERVQLQLSELVQRYHGGGQRDDGS